jgi:hypothetical protein
MRVAILKDHFAWRFNVLIFDIFFFPFFKATTPATTASTTGNVQ